ncbi:hypothetical protein EGU54_12580 [Achromobacter aegrifaciens]|nr:hypothetical protein EGU54_12580 [Achromobacter aegrifaciens]
MEPSSTGLGGLAALKVAMAYGIPAAIAAILGLLIMPPRTARDPTLRRRDQLMNAAETTPLGDMEDVCASNDTKGGVVRKGMDRADFEALPRVWPLRQWTT